MENTNKAIMGAVIEIEEACIAIERATGIMGILSEIDKQSDMYSKSVVDTAFTVYLTLYDTTKLIEESLQKITKELREGNCTGDLSVKRKTVFTKSLAN